MTLFYSNEGTRFDLEFRQGSTVGPFRHVLKNPNGSAVDLTGCSLQSVIRHDSEGEPLAAFSFQFAPDRTDGWYEFWLTAESSALLPAGLTSFSVTSVHEYSIALVDSAGRVLPLLWGSMSVRA